MSDLLNELINIEIFCESEYDDLKEKEDCLDELCEYILFHCREYVDTDLDCDDECEEDCLGECEEDIYCIYW